MTVKNIQSNYGNATAEYARKCESTEESYRKILERKFTQQEEVIQNGSTEKAIPLGSEEFTDTEWDALLANYDATLNDLREQMRAEHKKRYEEQRKKLAEEEREREYANIASDKGDCYETVFKFTKRRQVLGRDFSGYKIQEEFLTENEIVIERIKSDKELEQENFKN